MESVLCMVVKPSPSAQEIELYITLKTQFSCDRDTNTLTGQSEDPLLWYRPFLCMSSTIGRSVVVKEIKGGSLQSRSRQERIAQEYVWFRASDFE